MNYIKTTAYFLIAFFFFYLFSHEDRIYKNWQEEFKQLYRSYISLKKECKKTISPGERILVKATKLKNLKNHFHSGILGKARLSIYFHFQPRLKFYFQHLAVTDTNYFVEKVDQSGALKPINSVPKSELNKLDNNLEDIKKFMTKYDIGFFLCSYRNWWATKKQLAAAGLKLVASNKYFILSSIAKVNE